MKSSEMQKRGHDGGKAVKYCSLVSVLREVLFLKGKDDLKKSHVYKISSLWLKVVKRDNHLMKQSFVYSFPG